VSLNCEAITFFYAGTSGDRAAVALMGSVDGRNWHAITDKKQATGSTFLPAPPQWLVPKVFGPARDTMVACRIFAKLRGA
jgi:hypothetical protein